MSIVVACVSLGTNTRERMNASKILEWLCGSSCVMFLGILNRVWNVFCPEKNTCYIMGAPKGFGIEGMLGSRYDCIG